MGVPYVFCAPQMRGVERSTQNNPVNCFGYGDRSFLLDVTEEVIWNIEQKARTTPLDEISYPRERNSHCHVVSLCFLKK